MNNSSLESSTIKKSNKRNTYVILKNIWQFRRESHLLNII